CPRDDVIHIGVFPGVSVVAAKEFAGDYPSRLPKRLLAAAAGRRMYLHAMHSFVDWHAFALWTDGNLVRSLSLSPDSGILDDIGQRCSFEEPYWSGQHPVDNDDEETGEEDKYPLPFHPLDLGEVTLREFFGYQLEGFIDPTLLEPESIPLVRYRRLS